MTTRSGIVLDMPEFEYHDHPALSSTEARLILDAPAKYRWKKDHPPLVAPSKKFDVGSAVHAKVLGTGYEAVLIPAELLASNGAASTVAAKEFIAAARTEGKIPLKGEDFDPIDAQAESVLSNQSARAIFQQPGNPEASVFATDTDTSVQVRARFDYLPDLSKPGAVAADLKTTAGKATPTEFGKAVLRYGYHIQQEHYLHALNNAGVDGHMPRFAFVVVEKEPPYLTAVLQIPDVLGDLGRKKAAKARRLYADGMATGVWPGRTEAAEFIDVPNWVFYEEEDE